MTEPDKRRFSRIPKNVRIGISELRYPMPEGVEAEAQARDISKDGISFTASTAYPAGAILALKIELTGWQRHRRSLASKLDERAASDPLTAVVKVVWCTPSVAGDGFDIGVHFEDIYEDDYNALLKQLEALSETVDFRNPHESA